MDATSSLILCLLTAITAWLFTYAARSIAPKLNLVDRPGGRKQHIRATPLLGGVAFYLAFLVGALAAMPITRTPWSSFMLWLGVCGGAFCLIGLVDDKWNLRARDKLVLQILASLPFALWARSIDSVQLAGAEFQLGWFGVAFTVFWLVACTNVVNLLDGIDGLAGSIGVITALAVGLLSVMHGKLEIATASILVAGALTGFLVHNLPPARVFLGDAGSLTIGFLTGALAIEGSTKTATGFMLTAPLVVMSIPAFDAFLAIVRRKLSGRGIGVADRGHIHHRLLDRGLSGVQTLAVITIVSLAMSAAAVASTYFHSDLLGLALCGAIIIGLVAAKVCGRHETDLLFRHLRLAAKALTDASGLFRSRMAMTRFEMTDASQREAFWGEVCRAAETAGARTLVFQLKTGQGDSQRTWTAPAAVGDDDGRWRIDYAASRTIGSASISAEGSRAGREHPQGMDELFGMAAVLCRSWPLDVSADQDEPRHGEILGFPSEGAHAERDTPGRRAA